MAVTPESGTCDHQGYEVDHHMPIENPRKLNKALEKPTTGPLDYSSSGFPSPPSLITEEYPCLCTLCGCTDKLLPTAQGILVGANHWKLEGTLGIEPFAMIAMDSWTNIILIGKPSTGPFSIANC